VFRDVQIPDNKSEDSIAFKRNNDPNAVFVVNGSSRGIGLQFVQSLAQLTKGKIVACCRSPDTASDLQSIASQNQRVQIFPLDMEQQSTIDALASTLAKDYQRVDALFNVAGILGDGINTPGPERALAAIERDWLDKTLAVNVVGPVMLTKALSPLMRTTGRKTITFDSLNALGETEQLKVDLPQGRPPTVVASLSARVGSISDNRLGGWYSYRLSKSALNQATKTLGLELKRQGTW
jgi:NAD(P)-dependent dehydrogenase (short-subunit alcohol dehydrogenase family)